MQTQAAGRRIGAVDSPTRAALIAAGIAVFREQGAAALSARSVAERAGLKTNIVHYYFRTIEDLILAIVRHVGAEELKRTVRAAASDQPLRDLWRSCKEGGPPTLAAEIKALAMHSAVIREEAIRLYEQHRTMMEEAIRRHFEVLAARGFAPRNSPMSIAMVVDALTRLLLEEKALGLTLGHAEFEGAIESWLDGFYGPEAAPAKDARRMADSMRAAGG